MKNQIRIAALTAAVGAVFATPAGAVSIFGAGASAVNNSAKLLVLKDYCKAQVGTTNTADYYDNDSNYAKGGSIYRITCPPASGSGFTSTLVDISYDTTGGSWKGFTAVSDAIYSAAQVAGPTTNATPVATIDTTIACGSTFTSTVAVLGNSFNINYHGKCTTRALVHGTDTVWFGLTDVEPNLFLASGDNQPLQNGAWNAGSANLGTALISNFVGDLTPLTEASGITTNSGSGGAYPVPAFGVVFGVIASPKLYSALQADQIATGAISASGCVAGTVATIANDKCAPYITHDQYASIIMNPEGVGPALSSSLASLFTSLVPATTTYELARRDNGSGTNASVNAYFLEDGCIGANDLEPASTPRLPYNATGANVSYNQTTGDVIKSVGNPAFHALDGGSGFVIGVVSAENEGKLSAGAGFLKLEGFYPSVANAQIGRYSYVSLENIHFNSAATASMVGGPNNDVWQFAQDLIRDNPGGNLTESLLAYGFAGTAGSVTVNNKVNGIVPQGVVYSDSSAGVGIVTWVNQPTGWGALTTTPGILVPYTNFGSFCTGWVKF